MSTVTPEERQAHGRRADSFPPDQLVYSLSSVELIKRDMVDALDFRTETNHHVIEEATYLAMQEFEGKSAPWIPVQAQAIREIVEQLNAKRRKEMNEEERNPKTMTTDEGLTAVLAEHQASIYYDGEPDGCRCGVVMDGWPDHLAHVAAMLRKDGWVHRDEARTVLSADEFTEHRTREEL